MLLCEENKTSVLNSSEAEGTWCSGFQPACSAVLARPSSQPADVLCPSMDGVFYQGEFAQDSLSEGQMIIWFSFLFILRVMNKRCWKHDLWRGRSTELPPSKPTFSYLTAHMQEDFTVPWKKKINPWASLVLLQSCTESPRSWRLGAGHPGAEAQGVTVEISEKCCHSLQLEIQFFASAAQWKKVRGKSLCMWDRFTYKTM